MEKDLTTGKTLRVLLSFTGPLFWGNLFTQFYYAEGSMFQFIWINSGQWCKTVPG